MSGEFRSAVTVGGMQPGNNWRFGAAGRDAELDPLQPIIDDAFSRLCYDTDGDGRWEPAAGEPDLMDESSAVNGAHVSPLLTVWRKLHVEVDSMTVVQGNIWNDTAANVVNNGATSTVTLGTGFADPANNNRFEGGKLYDLLANEFEIVSNTMTTVTVNNLADGTAPAGGSARVTLHDDDHLQDGDDVPMPDTSQLDEAMAEAFVLPLFDVGDSNNDVPFVPNVAFTNNAVVAAQDWDSVNSNSQPYWVAYVLGAFQSSTDRDRDPDGDGGEFGVTPSDDRGGSLIYMEFHNEYANSIIQQQITVVHEVGHAVGKRYTEPVTLADNDVTKPNRYLEDYLNAIRSIEKPASR